MKKPPEELKRNPGAMTDRQCKCGCGRALRVNNTSGWSGYCNSRKVAAGDRAPRAPRAAAKSVEDLAASRTVTAEQLDVAKLSDEALVKLTLCCRSECTARQERIRREADDRARALADALEAA